MRKIFAIVSAATFMLGCSSSSELASAADPIADTEKQSSNYPTLKITARMTDEGVECPALRGDDNTLYAISNMPSEIKFGDTLNIIVRNPIENIVSFCQQGQTLEWIRIELLSSTKEVVKHWTK